MIKRRWWVTFAAAGVALSFAGSAFADLDSDGDGVLDALDNCPTVPNPNQENINPVDGQGDACDDSDGDNISDATEIGDDHANPRDSDGDGKPDYLDDDSDGDGVPDSVEVGFLGLDAPPVDIDSDKVPDYLDLDSDDDGVLDAYDNCRVAENIDQADLDGDALGDACDDDQDGDGFAGFDDDCSNIPDPEQDNPCAPLSDSDADMFIDAKDNCPYSYNKDQADTDADGIGDVCDPDLDGDGISNDIDVCPAAPDPGQSDADGDGLGDACDPCPSEPGMTCDGAGGSSGGGGGGGGGGSAPYVVSGCTCAVAPSGEHAFSGALAALSLAALLRIRRRKKGAPADQRGE